MDIRWRPRALSVCRAGHRRRRQGRPEDCEDRAAIEGGPVMAQAFAEQLGHRTGRRNRGGFARPCLGSAAPALRARALSRSDADTAAFDVLLCGAFGHRVRFPRRGGPGVGRSLGSRLCGIPLHPAMGCDWPETEHGIFVSDDGHVYIGGNGGPDYQVIKFTGDGTFVMQIGRAGMRGSSHPVQFAPNGTPLLGRPAEMDLDRATNELYIADGYQNRRIIVVDATTGQYKRHWGAYGSVPNDVDPGPYDPNAPLAQQFRTPVHCVAVASDGLIYVCDRLNNRIQVFQKNGSFVSEFFTDRNTLGNGSAYNAGLSPDRKQTYLFNADGENQHIWTFLRHTGEVLTKTGRGGRFPGHFAAVHSLAVDSKGNVYTGEVDAGMRLQKFSNLGLRPIRSDRQGDDDD